jgi:hypothetical protein
MSVGCNDAPQRSVSTRQDRWGALSADLAISGPLDKLVIAGRCVLSTQSWPGFGISSEVELYQL